MRLLQLFKVTEAIPVAPRRFKPYVENRLKNLRFIQEKSEELEGIYQKLKSDDSEMFRDIERDISSAIQYDVEGDIRADDITYWGEPTYREETRLAQDLNIDPLISNLEFALQSTPEGDPGMAHLASGLSRFNSYLIGDLAKQAIDSYNRIKQLVSKKEEIKRLVKEYGSLDEKYPAEANVAKKILSMLDILEEVIPAYERVLETPEKFQVILDKRAAFFRGQAQHVPETEDVEELYHASAYASELVQQGFRLGGRGERRGADAFGGIEKTISFTHDLNIARDISRALKEIIMIANGQLKAHQILRWFESEGIDIERVRGLAQGDLTNTIRLYKVYLALSGMRDDPLFINLEENLPSFKGRDPRNVGVIKAQVNMRHPNINYLSSMAEFQVPPEAILSIERAL